jgi:hypothetical protein
MPNWQQRRNLNDFINRTRMKLKKHFFHLEDRRLHFSEFESLQILRVAPLLLPRTGITYMRIARRNGRLCSKPIIRRQIKERPGGGRPLARIMHDGVRSGTPDGGRMSSGRLAWAV